MKTTTEKLRGFKSSSPSRWRENAEARLAAQEERRKVRRIAMQMLNAMEEQHISEPTLAECLGVSVAEISPILKGHKLPTASLMASICSVLGISLGIVI